MHALCVLSVAESRVSAVFIAEKFLLCTRRWAGACPACRGCPGRTRHKLLSDFSLLTGERKSIPATRGCSGVRAGERREGWAGSAAWRSIRDGRAGSAAPHGTAELELQMGHETSCCSTFYSSAEGTGLTQLPHFWLSQNKMTNSQMGKVLSLPGIRVSPAVGERSSCSEPCAWVRGTARLGCPRGWGCLGSGTRDARGVDPSVSLYVKFGCLNVFQAPCSPALGAEAGLGDSFLLFVCLSSCHFPAFLTSYQFFVSSEVVSCILGSQTLWVLRASLDLSHRSP